MLNKSNYKGTIAKLFLIVAIVLCNTTTLYAATTYPTIDANAFILVDSETGMIMNGSDINEVNGIASLTKLMSVYVVLDEMKTQNIKLDEKVPVSKRASTLKTQSVEVSGFWYNEGDVLTVEELIELSLIYSDNTAIIALSEYVSGSEAKHVEKMNQKAKDLGMENTTFYNVTGLTMSDYGSIKVPGTKGTDYNKSTAKDLAIMIDNMLEDYPEVLEVTQIENVSHDGQEVVTWNMMLPNQPYAYDGVKGLKTGTSIEAGSCFAGYYESSNGHEYISIVLGSSSGEQRFEQTAVMYQWIDTQKFETLVSEGKTKEVDVPGSTIGQEQLKVDNKIETLQGESLQMELSNIEYNDKYFEDKQLVSDIPKGEKVASIGFDTINDSDSDEIYDNPIQNIEATKYDLEITLVANEDIKKQTFLGNAIMAVPEFFLDLYKNII